VVLTCIDLGDALGFGPLHGCAETPRGVVRSVRGGANRARQQLIESKFQEAGRLTWTGEEGERGQAWLAADLRL
jgi:hypothetical protein